MPRQVAPPPSGEFQVVLSKPFSGAPTHQIEVIGEPNRSASIRLTNYNGSQKSSEKKGDVPADDVNELMSLVNTLRGFPSHNTKDIQWSNKEDDSAADVVNEIAGEQKDDFKRIADSIGALARTFAKQDSAI